MVLKKTATQIALCFFSFSFLLILGSCNDTTETEKIDRPNILLIVADDLGISDLGCYGGEIRTPNLDQLAATGIRSTSFHTAPTCSPTRAMLLTGVDNHLNGYGTMEGDWAENQLGIRGYEGHLNWDVVTFPKLLQDDGYHTSIAGKWHQAYPATDTTLWPQKRGFSRSFCLIQGGAGHFADQQKMFSFFDRSYYTEDGIIIDTLPKDFYSSNFYTDKAIQYIDESIRLEKPFFSYLAFTAPHWPLQIPDEYIELYQGEYDSGYESLAESRLAKAKELAILPEYIGQPASSPNVKPWDSLSQFEKDSSARIMEIYAAMVERLDANIGRLIQHLKSIEAYENTLIVFMSDNGAEGNSIWGIADTKDWVAENFNNSIENMGKRNSYVFTGPSWAQLSSLPYKWYKGFASEGGVRSPFIISYPKWTKQFGKINTQFLSVMDIAPTFLDFAEVEHPVSNYKGRMIYPMDGTSMIDWLTGKKENVHAHGKFHCWELYGRKAVLKDHWKAEWIDQPYGKGNWELYDLNRDLAQEIDLAKRYPDTLNLLIHAWDKYAQKYNLVLPNEHVAYGTEEYWDEAE